MRRKVVVETLREIDAAHLGAQNRGGWDYADGCDGFHIRSSGRAGYVEVGLALGRLYYFPVETCREAVATSMHAASPATVGVSKITLKGNSTPKRSRSESSP